MNAWPLRACSVVVMAATVLAACGGSVTLPDFGDVGVTTDAGGGDVTIGDARSDVGGGGGDGGDGGGDAGTDVGFDFGIDAPFDAGAGCPASPPTGACASDGLVCSYPGACSGGGTLTVLCTGGHWADSPGSCPPPFDAGSDAGAPTCPSSEPAQDSPCASIGEICTYPAPGCPAGTDEAVQCDSSGWDITHVDCSGTDGGSGGACPSALPTDGSSCSNAGLVCGYGDDPRPTCRSQATCDGSSWSVDMVECSTPPTAICPISESLASGFPCTPTGAFCTYGDVTCGCSMCGPGPCGSTPKWTCDSPPTGAGCPGTMPNLGVACTSEGASCAYGSCGDGTSAGRTCTGGVWVNQPLACPG